MRASSNLIAATAAAVALTLAAPAGPAGAQAARPDPMAPYAVLIGRWDTGPRSGGPTAFVQTFSWGANRAFIRQATSIVTDGGEEPHMEGLMAWNGVNRNLDYLFVIDLRRGLAQERGTYAAAADGSIVREVTATFDAAAGPAVGPGGGTQQFRQTFTPIGDGRMLTALWRKTPDGWVPTFPGSDQLLMVRRDGG